MATNFTMWQYSISRISRFDLKESAGTKILLLLFNLSSLLVGYPPPPYKNPLGNIFLVYDVLCQMPMKMPLNV